MAGRDGLITTFPQFEAQGSWGSGYAQARGDGPGVVVGPGFSNPNILAQTFTADAGAAYRIVAEGGGLGSDIVRGCTQVNWFDAGGNFLGVGKTLFDLGPGVSRHESIVTAPSGTASAALYVVPGNGVDVVRYTEMAVFRLDPLKDFFSYTYHGVSAPVWSIAALATVLCLTVLRSRLRRLFLSGFGMRDTADAPRARWMGWVFPLIALLLSGLPFLFLEWFYEINDDAHWHQGAIENVMRWKTLSLDLGGDVLHNFGIQHAINPQLSPTFWIGQLAGIDHRIQVQGAAQAILFFLLLAINVRSVRGVTRNAASAIALIGTYFLTIPDLTDGVLTFNAGLGLIWQDTALGVLCALSCFSRIGRGKRIVRTSVSAALGLFASILWIVLAFPEMAAFFAIATAITCCGGLVASASRREFLYKCSASGVIAALLGIVGLHDYLINLYSYTPQMIFKVISAPYYSFQISQCNLLLYMPKYYLPLLIVYYIFSLIGCFVLIRRKCEFSRSIAFSAIGLEVGILILSGLNTIHTFLPLSFIYVELTGMPVVALLAGVGVWTVGLRFLSASLHRVAWRNPSDVPAIRESAGILILMSACVILFLHLSERGSLPGTWPPRATAAPVRIMTDALALDPGDFFKGRGISLLGMDEAKSVDWASVVVPIRQKFRGTFENDLFIDPETLNVPIVNEYGHWFSPEMLALMATGFYDERDPIDRAVQVPRRFRLNLSRLMGVSLVVADGDLEGREPVYRQEVEGHPVAVYRIDDVNLGQYSPTRMLPAKTAKDIIDALRAPDFDGRRTAVSEVEVAESLTPVRYARVRVDRGPKLHVEAGSDDRSLLVLPFEYSHCLELTGTGVERLLPVNLAQTGVIVRGEASFDIVYRYGLFGHASCRKRDLERVRDLGLEDAVTGRLFADQRPRIVR